MLHTCVRGAVAAFLAAAAYVAVPVAPASAAACSTDHGVTVVVDFGELGGGVQTDCVADGGGQSASGLFPDAGFALSYVQRQPGFVCRVADRPASEPCVNTPPADAYWALFWSDGKSGSWTYATTGAPGLRVPDGGYVGFAWNGSSTRTTPGFSPAPHPSPTPTPTPTHSATPSAHPSAHPSSHSTNGPAASPTTSESSTPPSDKPKPSKKPTKSATSAEPSEVPDSAEPSDSSSASPDAVPTSAEPTDPDDSGLPAWVAPAVIVVLFGAAGAAAVIRRRRGAA